MGASRALEELAKLTPSDAPLIYIEGNITEVDVTELKQGDHVLVKPRESTGIWKDTRR